MAELEQRAHTAGDPKNPGPQDKKGPSDITGTDQKGSPQQQAGGPQGGGGSPQGGGGGSPSGSGPAQGFDQGGGSNASTPPSFNGGNKTLADSSSKTKNNKAGGSTPGSLVPTSDGKKSPIGNSGLITGGGASPEFGVGGSRSLASSGSGRTSSSASSSGPGGGGGLGGGGGSGGAAGCIGKECTQVMGATGSQFAGAGNLGAGGGFGADGGSDSLDNLFKSDDKSAMAGAEGPGADALGDLEGALDNSLDGGASGDLAAGGEGEIGGANGANLFDRVKTTYVRAQKKGFVAGMLKKL